jgi:hypothetical protein
MARLFGTPVPQPAPEPSPVAPAEPLPEATRRFVAPLVGVNPAPVRVRIDEPATTAHNADALASENEIVLAPNQPPSEPETIGLIAHELTHLARQQDRRFVPPVLHAAPEPVEFAEDETVARQVEERVTRIAAHPTEAPPDLAPSFEAWSDEAGDDEEFVLRPAAARLVDGEPENDWGGLPAPWEPMPEVPPSSSPAPAPPAPVDRAEVGREPEAGPPPEPAPTPDAPPQPAPDINALAAQVYAVLRRRLRDEAERIGGR